MLLSIISSSPLFESLAKFENDLWRLDRRAIFVLKQTRRREIRAIVERLSITNKSNNVHEDHELDYSLSTHSLCELLVD